MNLRKMRGVGGLNVYVSGGLLFEGAGDAQTVAYQDLDGLYLEIGRAIALRAGSMTAEEARFLRKRLSMTQEELGALGGKQDQVAAKWEKGQLPVPLAEANLLRLLWLSSFSRPDVRKTLRLEHLTDNAQTVDCYVFRFDGSRWGRELGTAVEATHNSARVDADLVIHVARASASHTQYTRAFGEQTCMTQ